jgi:hypothetical protein
VSIGQLYASNNVVVGQAACFVAPANTPMADPSTVVMGDAFSPTPWAAATLSTTLALTAGTYILTYTLNGVAYPVATALSYNATNAIIQSALLTALTGAGAVAGDVVVTGGPLTTATTPIKINLDDKLIGGTWALSALTGIAPGTAKLSIANPLWLPLGATDQGWTFASNKTTQTIDIEEQSTPVAITMTTQAMMIQGALSEDVTHVLAIAYNMTQHFTAPTTTTPGYQTLTATDSVLEYAVALVMQNLYGYPRWLYIPQSTSLTNVTGAFRRASAKRMYAVEFSSVCPINQIKMLEFTRVHT